MQRKENSSIQIQSFLFAGHRDCWARIDTETRNFPFWKVFILTKYFSYICFYPYKISHIFVLCSVIRINCFTNFLCKCSSQAPITFWNVFIFKWFSLLFSVKDSRENCKYYLIAGQLATFSWEEICMTGKSLERRYWSSYLLLSF